MNWKLLRTALLSTVATCAAYPALAQDAAPQNGDEGSIYLDQMTVTTTRNPLPAFDAPGMVTVIDRADLQRVQPSTPDDVLRFVPGVEFNGGPRRTGETPSIRGFDGADVVIMFDGARQNFGSAHDGRFFVDPELLRSVEVLRGSASSLYGSGGTGGVIEFRTARAGDFLLPGETSGARIAAGYQDVNSEEFGSLTAYTQSNSGVDIIGNVTVRDSGAIKLGGGGKLVNSDDDVVSGMLKAGAEVNENHYVEASYVAFFNEAEEPNNGQGAGGADVVKKDISSQTLRLAYTYDNPDDKLLSLDLVAYYTLSQADELRLDNLGIGPADQLLTRDVQTVGFRLDNRSDVPLSDSIGALYTYGLEFYRDEQTGDAGGAVRAGVPNAEANTFGAFAQAEFKAKNLGLLPGELLFVPGVRADYYSIQSDVAGGSKTKETAISPRFALTYKPAPWAMTFASYGDAFRAPTFDELFLTGVHFQIPIGPGIVNRFVPNPNLKPQQTETIEFGGGLEFDSVIQTGDRFQAKGSYFFIYGEDFIALDVNQPAPFIDCNPFIPGNCDGTTTSKNIDKAELEGFEFEGGYESNRFKAALGFSSITGKDATTGVPIGTLAPDQVTASFGVKIPEIDSFVGWRAIFASKFDDTNDPTEIRAAYDTHDFFASYAPVAGELRGFRVDLGVDNAFDEAYSRTFTGANEPGRNFKATVSYRLSF